MKGFCETAVASKYSSKSSTDSTDRGSSSACSDSGSRDSKHNKASLWTNFFASAFSIFETHSESSITEKKESHSRNNGWTAAVRKAVTSGSMRRIHERVLGSSRTGISSASDIWLLGVCYKVSQDDSSGDAPINNGLGAFEQDFSSKILMTYRKGFEAIGDSKYTSDVNWGCMLRSSQMLVAQALLFHRLGRSWRRPLHKPLDEAYIEILYHFGDSETSTFSIHNLLQAGKAYDLAAGSWVGPYAMCRTWETLVRCRREVTDLDDQPLPMAVYIVSGDEDGERGGAPVVCIEDASRHCLEFSRGQVDWTPILLLVPLVLGLEKVNPRYIPSLRATFTFPQSLGIMGGKPGASTYIIGVQDEKALYLDPHEVQPVINIRRDDLEADTLSYHCNVIRHIPLDLIDPSLAIGFYCRDRDDFNDFCFRASKLADESNGAPLFTVTQTHSFPRPVNHSDALGDSGAVENDDPFSVLPMSDADGSAQEDDWQLL
ncbi:cysteine protease ATG4 isoform X1 [Pyrus x bretschneideri]|uniref:cysteine protease ATG4 isoform X1 n=1 Tax=Pyrus x bretschneideri TaxID=225117 RepID=UPI00203048BF|nr:cysteine protease ATG4 isoform X1 [Pyrus x bretschneideri]XP_009354663.2 cysteine protease ATG4 isoform X1 [Pyrus x bretschneideri]